MFVMPVDPVETATWTEIRIWEKKFDSYAKCEEALEQNLQGQCTEIMLASLKSLPTYEDIASYLLSRALSTCSKVKSIFHMLSIDLYVTSIF